MRLSGLLLCLGLAVGALAASAAPTSVESSYAGGEAGDLVQAIAVGSDGALFVAGQTSSTTFPGAAQVTHVGSIARGAADAFVAKFSADRTELEWVLTLGGSDLDSAEGLAVIEGAIGIAGYTLSDDFPTEDALQDDPADRCGSDDSLCVSDGWVARIDADGSSVEFATYLGGSRMDQVTDLAASGSGDLVAVGRSRSRDLLGTDSFQPALAGGIDDFVIKLGADGSEVKRGTFIGGSQDEGWPSLDIAGDGGVVLSSSTRSPDFPVERPLRVKAGSGEDAIVARLNRALSRLTFSSTYGGSGSDAAWDVVVHGSGRLAVVGSTASRDLPLRRAHQASRRGDSDAFIALINSRRRRLVFATYLGGSNYDIGWTTARSGTDISISGETPSLDFPTRKAIQPEPATSDCPLEEIHCTDAFAASFTRWGQLRWSTYLGGSRFDSAYAMERVPEGLVLGGLTWSPDFPGASMPQPALQGPYDGFLARFTPR